RVPIRNPTPIATPGAIRETEPRIHSLGGPTMADERPVLDQINLVVSDMDASLAFYRRVGVDFPDWQPRWDAHHRSAKIAGGLDFDLDSAVFARDWNEGSRGPAAVLSFQLAR